MNGQSYAFKSLLFIPEVNEVIGVTNRKSMIVWRYNPNAVINILTGHTDSLECLTFSIKANTNNLLNDGFTSQKRADPILQWRR